MQIFSNKAWRDGFPSYERFLENHVKLAVSDWFLLGQVDDQFISYSFDWRIIWNYLLDVGFRAVFLKLKSRIREKHRNEKFYSVGLGVVIEPDENENFSSGEVVAFFAPNHPQCASEIVLPDSLLFKSGEKAEKPEKINFFTQPDLKNLTNLEKYIGWSSFSGLPIEPSEISHDLNSFLQQIREKKPATGGRVLKVTSQNQPSDSNSEDGRLKAALFGLGNYAKTFIIPNLDPRISLCSVHEIDPAQIGLKKWGDGQMSTTPFPNPKEKFDVYFAAGYHHTHADIAIHALERGAYAVIEKPIVTDRQQLDRLKSLASEGRGNFFACFHKRYSKLNQLALEDLGHEVGEAIDYSCIVFEIPLPKRHWYNWPNAGSRILSNGCHWIDHFMFLNSYSLAVNYSVQKSKSGQILVFIELENGATFSMMLTDHGSPRLGVRDYIELRKGKTTVYMTDSSEYRSENHRGWLRKTRINKMDAYRSMYAKISSQIAEKKPGDSIDSLRSSQLVIELDELLQQGNDK